jgi:hypothetical protein
MVDVVRGGRQRLSFVTGEPTGLQCSMGVKDVSQRYSLSGLRTPHDCLPSPSAGPAINGLQVIYPIPSHSAARMAYRTGFSRRKQATTPGKDFWSQYCLPCKIVRVVSSGSTLHPCTARRNPRCMHAKAH